MYSKTFCRNEYNVYVRSLSFGVEKDLYDTVLVPTVTHGAETGGLKMDDILKLDVMETKCSRSMCGVTRITRGRNEGLRLRVDARENISDSVDRKVLK